MGAQSTTLDDRRLQIRSEKRRLGLVYGLAAGIALSLGIWGWDAFLLASVHSLAPGLKYLLGAPLLILVCSLAGWLTARVDNALLGGLVWLLAGIAAVCAAVIVPFQGLSTVIGIISPEYAGQSIYPFGASAQTRTVLLMIAGGGLLMIAGALETNFLDGMIQASTLGGRLFRLLMAMLIFIAIGLLIDSLINQPLRRPLVAVDALIQRGREIQSRPELSQQTAMKLTVSTLRSLGDLINRPYHMALGTYDAESMVETSAYVDFQGVWSTCFVVEDNPLVCHLSSDRYLNGLACLIDSNASKPCNIKLLPGAKEAIQSVSAELGGKDLSYGILDQRGSTVVAIVAATDGSRQYQCLLREGGDVYLESCTATAGRDFIAVPVANKQPASNATTSPAPAATPAAGVSPAGTPEAATENDSSGSSPQGMLPPAEQAGAAGWQPGNPAVAMLPTARPDIQKLPAIPHYLIDVNIATSMSSYTGDQRLEYTNLETVALDKLYFRLLPNGGKSFGNGSLEVDSVLVNGQAGEGGVSPGDRSVYELKLPAPLQPGEKTEIEMKFTGQVPEDFGGSAQSDAYGIFNLTDDVLDISTWYPILAVYDEEGWNLDPVSAMGDSVFSESALFSVRICAGNDVVVVATGVTVARQEVGDATCTQLETGPVRDFFIAASPQFAVQSQVVDGVTVNSYYLPGHEASAAKVLQVSADSLQIYDEKFGQYPFAELDVIDAPMRNALGVEYPGLILVGSSLYDNPDRPEFPMATAHEVAHQWWYSVVGNDIFEEPWLDEGLTSFSSTLYFEFAESPGVAQGYWDYWQERYNRLKDEGKDDPVNESLHYFEADPAGRSYSSVVYVKGALFFRALRKEIGDEAFFSALQNYYQDHKYGVARGADLLAAFETAAGRKLDDFYGQWLSLK